MAPSTMSANQSEPFLPPKLMNEPSAQPLPPASAGAIKVVSALRIALGAACIIAPRWSCAVFAFPIPANMSLLPRLFGIRDLILGELLFTAEDKNSPHGGRREIKRALWANIAADAVDMGSLAFGVATGTVGRFAAVLFAGAAASAIGLEVLGLQGL